MDKKVITGKEFINKTVELDGNAYRSCTFENVTFVYRGLAPFELVNNQISGVIVIRTTPHIVTFAIMMESFGFLHAIHKSGAILRIEELKDEVHL